MTILEIVFGPMFSGKTTKLIDTYEKLLKQGEKPIIINYKGDIESTETMLKNHDNKIVNCISYYKLRTGWTDKNDVNYEIIHNSKYILINECQFFEDLYEIVLLMLNTKNVYIYGLDSDYMQRKFGQVWDLIPHANSVIKLTARCSNCNSKYAIFTNRIFTGEPLQQILIGVKYYEVLCRDCKNKLVK